MKDRSMLITLLCCIAAITAAVLLLVVSITPRVDWAVYGIVCAGGAGIALLSAYTGGILACAYARASMREEDRATMASREAFESLRNMFNRYEAEFGSRVREFERDVAAFEAQMEKMRRTAASAAAIASLASELGNVDDLDLDLGPGADGAAAAPTLLEEYHLALADLAVERRHSAEAVEMLLDEVETMRAGINELDSKHQYVPVDVITNTLAVMEDAAAILTVTGKPGDTPNAPADPMQSAHAGPVVNSLATGSATPSPE